jgi:hypothetical protein
MPDRNEVIYRGLVTWTEDEDEAKSLDIPLPNNGPGEGEAFLVTVVNGSADVDLDVNIGNMIRATGSDDLTREYRECTLSDDAGGDSVLLTGHGFVAGQAIEFETTNADVTAGTIYYVLDASDADEFTFSDARDGSAVELSTDDTNRVRPAAEFAQTTEFTVEKFASGSSTAAPAGVKSVVVVGFPNGECGRLYLCKSAVTAAPFSAFVEVRRA